MQVVGQPFLLLGSNSGKQSDKGAMDTTHLEVL